MGCHVLLQRPFLTQGSNPNLLHLLLCRQILYRLAPREALWQYTVRCCSQSKAEYSPQHTAVVAGRPLSHTPFPGSGYHSTSHGPAQPLVGATVGPAHKQPAVQEWPWVGHSANCKWNAGRGVRSEVRADSGLPLPRPSIPAHGVLGQQVSWGGSRTNWGLSPAWLQSPLQGHALAGLRPWDSGDPLPHPCPCDLTATAACLGRSLWDPLPTHLPCHPGWPKEPGARWVLGIWLPQLWQLLGRVWRPGREGAANWDLPPLLQDRELRGGKLCLGTLLSLVRE